MLCISMMNACSVNEKPNARATVAPAEYKIQSNVNIKPIEVQPSLAETKQQNNRVIRSQQPKPVIGVVESSSYQNYKPVNVSINTAIKPIKTSSKPKAIEVTPKPKIEPVEENDPFSPPNKAIAKESFEQDQLPTKNISPVVKSLIFRAQADMLLKRYDAAIILLERALRIDNQVAKVWHMLATVYYEKKNIPQSKYMAQKSLKLAKTFYQQAYIDKNQTLLIQLNQAN